MIIMPKKLVVCRAGYVGQVERERIRNLTGEISVEPGNINFPLGGLLLQALQFSLGSGCLSL
jgi:hypothetical protein